MTKFPLLLAAAAAAIATSPAAARPMTAIDLQSMHRLGSPAVSPDGRWAVFTVSSTDWAKNKRVNTLELLDLSKPGARPQPILGAEKGHDAMFSGDGSLWFLMPVGDQDQLFRMSIGNGPVPVSSFKGDIGGFRIAPSGTEAVVWADRDLRCPDLNCASVAEAKAIGSGRTYDQLFIRHWDTWEKPGVRSRRVRTSWSVMSSAWPMWSEPVTFGGGMTIVHGCASGRSGRNRPSPSQCTYHRCSIAVGSKVFGSSLIAARG
jgi:dipeptidyl aminopeptidase/acylaminoacyl peptidase